MTSFRTWIHGLAAAFIGGAAASITNLIVAPESFNATPEGLRKLGWAILASGVVAAALYLKQSPLPPPEKSDSEKTG